MLLLINISIIIAICCPRFPVLRDSFDSQCLRILTIQVNSAFTRQNRARLFSLLHFEDEYNNKQNDSLKKEKKDKYPDEKFAQRMKNSWKKLLTLARIVSGSSVS